MIDVRPPPHRPRFHRSLELILFTEILIVALLTILNGVLAMSEMAVVSSRTTLARIAEIGR